MLQILTIILCAASLAVVHNKKIEDFLAPVIMTAMLFIYCGGILKFSLRVFSYAAMALMLIISLAGAVYVYVRRTHARTLNIPSGKITGSPSHMGHIFTPSLIICILTCAFFSAIFSTHKLMHWDDLSYWGIYLKDIFCLDRLPIGVENCTISYKDYPPIQQIMQYFFMFTGDGFNEPVAFCVNVCFMYALMLPFLSGLSRLKSPSGKIMSVIMYVIFPHIFTTQFYYKLGLDYIISVLFGYGIYVIVREYETDTTDGDGIRGTAAGKIGENVGLCTCEKKNAGSGTGGNKSVWRMLLGNRDERFRLLNLIIISSYMALIKTSGGLLTVLLVIFYAVRVTAVSKYTNDQCAKAPGESEYNTAKENRSVPGGSIGCNNGCRRGNTAGTLKAFFTAALLSGIIPVGAYATWKLWGRYTGNHGYLSDIVSSNVSGLKFDLPPYAAEVTLNYIKHIFTYPLTRESIGVTAFAMIVIIAIMYHVRKRSLHVVMCAGIFIFCAAHLYMYLFVFDDWEAYGLLEFDRYINQYLAGILYVYLYDYVGDFERARIFSTAGNIRNCDSAAGDIGNCDKEEASSLKNCDSAAGDIKSCGAGRISVGAWLRQNINPAIVLTVFLIAMLPYSSIKQYLIPSNYDKNYEDNYVKTRTEAAAEWEDCALKALNLPLDEDHRVMLAGNAWTDEFQFLTLEMVPQAVTVATNVPALGEGEFCDFLTDQIIARGIEYIYIMNNADDDYPGDITAESQEKLGIALECGCSYYVDRSGDEMKFVKL